MKQIDDQQILDWLERSSKQEKGFRLLVESYQERLYWHIRKIVISHDDTNDVLQNTFIKAFRNLDGFERKSSLYTWMYRIATNESLTHIQKMKRLRAVPVDEESDYLLNTLKAEDYFDGDEVQRLLQEAVSTLPEKQRLVFNMKYFDEMKYNEISEILDTSVGSLKASFHHAVKKVEQYVIQKKRAS